jgi:hypothetical protein
MAWVSNGVNGMVSMKLRTRRKYFKSANLESILGNDVKKLSRVGIGCKLKENSESPALAGENRT